MVITHKSVFGTEVTEKSGQCFRWRRLGDGGFLIPAYGRAVAIKEINPHSLRLDCGYDDYQSVWRDYFNLSLDYSPLKKLAGDDPFLGKALSYGEGLRIISQEHWECLVTFILSQQCNIPRIKKSVERLCGIFGEERAHRGHLYNSFPEPKVLAMAEDSALDACRLGYRRDYVREAAKLVASGEIDLAALESLKDSELQRRLMDFKGVGTKIAQCVMLFSYGRYDAFPVDVWIGKVLANEYPKGFDHSRYSPYNGIAQQYMFHYYRENFSKR